jgi:hypothetical protein
MKGGLLRKSLPDLLSPSVSPLHRRVSRLVSARFIYKDSEAIYVFPENMAHEDQEA